VLLEMQLTCTVKPTDVRQYSSTAERGFHISCHSSSTAKLQPSQRVTDMLAGTYLWLYARARRQPTTTDSMEANDGITVFCITQHGVV
jgi:hypothetical protein